MESFYWASGTGGGGGKHYGGKPCFAEGSYWAICAGEAAWRWLRSREWRPGRSQPGVARRDRSSCSGHGRAALEGGNWQHSAPGHTSPHADLITQTSFECGSSRIGCPQEECVGKVRFSYYVLDFKGLAFGCERAYSWDS